jgi:hypothetical protein
MEPAPSALSTTTTVLDPSLGISTMHRKSTFGCRKDENRNLSTLAMPVVPDGDARLSRKSIAEVTKGQFLDLTS